MVVKLYVEGGGDSDRLHRRCREGFQQFFGQGFNAGALPKNDDIETISKQEIYEGLQRASLHCKTKSPYGKGEHSFVFDNIKGYHFG